MPRPKKPGAPEPKRRSRNGCWPCKGRKVKCGEERPKCVNCQRTGDTCDYSIRLNWEGRRVKRDSLGTSGGSSGGSGQGSETPLGPPVPFAFINQTNPQQKPPARNFWVGPAVLSPKETTNSTGGPTPIQFTPYNGGQAEAETKKMGFDSGRNTSSQMRYGQGHTQTQTQDSGGLIPSPIKTSGFIQSGRPGEQVMRFSDQPSTAGMQRRASSTSSTTFQRPHKRTKSNSESADADSFHQPASSPSSLNGASPTLAARFQPPGSIASLGSPLTPATPSSYSDDDPRIPPQPRRPSHSSPSNSYVRLSVNSLLSGPPGPGPVYGSVIDGMRFYGYDTGKFDYDAKNDDMNAISTSAPTPPTPKESLHLGPSASAKDGTEEDGLPSECRFGDQREGYYYKDPVPIWIPYSLEPLPSRLRENPMDLLYFHHFLNHTAGVLMPYDDYQSNPFRIILPQMAIKNDHLLSLLLAYSASHRARLLRQQEPQIRMARWLEDILPALQQSLNDSNQVVSTANLATAIMFSSLEIISPQAFDSNIPWNLRLNLARRLMRKRFSANRRIHSDYTVAAESEDQVCSFLWSWFAYLDVLGSFSGGARNEDISSTWLTDYGVLDLTDAPDEIDCIMGFTTRCVKLLAETADLARKCDSRRLIPSRNPNEPPTINPSWRPDVETINRAQNLVCQLRASMEVTSHPCKHIRQDSVSGGDVAEMRATNEAFHWAGIVQLHRRVLGKESRDRDVRAAVEEILKCLETIRRGGTAEMGILFPMFAAGCEMGEGDRREMILERFKSVERNGMMQVRGARELMERVWREGRPWETLLTSEFIG